MTRPHPTHLDQRDPGKAGVRSIREEVDLEVDAYEGVEGVVLLAPDDRWAAFLREAGLSEQDGRVTYRGVTIRPGPVTAVVAQEGF
jgi:hypothetical protein